MTSDLDAIDPIALFAGWYDEVLTSDLKNPTAVTLATADGGGHPTARMVLLKGFDERGFVFYTNFTSDKAVELDLTGRAALTFSWTELRRQVRVVGPAGRLSAEESDRYWATRPRGSRLGAWASDQSAIVPDRAHLERLFAGQEDRWAGAEVTRPDHWGGYLVRPEVVEFWQGRPDRLHDRLRYRLEGGTWVIERRAP